jgi:peptide/nickel transport system substrate-binding protein
MPRRVPFAVIAAVLAVGACAVRPPDPSGITLAIDSGPSSLDPRIGSDEASRRFQDLVFNAIVRTGDDARPIPDLAHTIETPDPLTVIVRLRPGVRFHDGATLTSADVADTYRSILEGRVPSFRRADLDRITAIETPDAATVVFRLQRPFAPLVGNLTVPILRAGTGAEAARHPIGTGPFRLARYRKDEDLLLDRFDAYFEGPAGPASIRLRIVPSETSRLLELLTGGVDMVVNDLPPDGLERVRRTPGFRVVSKPGRNAVYMAFNLSDPILGDTRVREAIACALDRDAVVRHLLRGTATLATGLLPPGHWAYNPDVESAPHDPARAARLLDAAGWPDPDGTGPAVRFRIEYKAPASDLARQQAAILQAQLAAVGIGIDVRTYEWATFYEDLRAGRFQIVVSNWTDISDPDVYRLRFHSEAVPPAGLNRGGYRSAEADLLIEAGAEQSDPATRLRSYARLQAVLAIERPYIVLWHRDATAVLGPRVGGFELLSGADFRPLWRARVRREGGGEPASSADAAADGGFQGARGDRAGAHQTRRVDGEIDDGRGASAAGRSAIQDQAHRIAESQRRFLGCGGWRSPRAVGAGGDDRPAERARQRGGDRMGGDPHADGVSPSQEARRQVVCRGQDERERPWPEGRHQAAGSVRDLPGAERDSVLVARDQRQGHAVGTALGLEDAIDGRGIARVARQPVKGFRRVDHEQALAQCLRGARDGGGVGILRVDAVHLGRHASLAFLCAGGPTIAQARHAVRAWRTPRPHRTTADV